MRMERKHKRRLIFLFLVIVAVGAAAFFSVPSHAATPLSVENVGGSIGLGTADLKGVILNVIRWLLGIMALVSVSFIIYGGFLWLTAAGNTERIEKAKRVILNAVIGLVIVLISWAIVFFVARVITDATNGTTQCDPSTDPLGCVPCTIGDARPLCGGDVTLGFSIQSITTDCGDPTTPKSDVYLCSGVNITFNHLVKDSTVSAAVLAGKLLIEDCGTDVNCNSPTTDVDPIKAQKYTADTPSGTGAEWVAMSNAAGKTTTFSHLQGLFERQHYYRITIPKTLEDKDGRKLLRCVPEVGCDEPVGANAFTWTMLTGTTVDTQGPKVTETYPDSKYLKQAAYRPDRNVPRVPYITIVYDQAIMPVDLASAISVIPFTTPPNTDTGFGTCNGDANAGTKCLADATCDSNDCSAKLGPALDPSLYDAVLDAPPGGIPVIRIQLKGTNKLEAFTWYKVVVRGIKDLCNNPQEPDPFEFVFETNDKVPGVSSVYPGNGTADACPNTPIAITYTTSMYDSAMSSCSVGTQYVRAGYLDPSAPGRSLRVNPLQQCNGCANPNDRCMVYEFDPTTVNLSVDTTYRAGVRNDYLMDDQGTTLNFGYGPWPQLSADKLWSFGVRPPGQCKNAPHIFSVQPSSGTVGQCLTITGVGFDPASDGKQGGDDLVLDNEGGKSTGGWTDGFITTAFPERNAGGTPYDLGAHRYKVKADFGSPYGVLESDNTGDFSLQAGPASDGPCLDSLSAYEGYQLDPVSAYGSRFGALGANSRFLFTTYPAPIRNWTQTQIDGTVPVVSPPERLQYDAVVRVKRDDSELSNPLQYTIKDYPPVQLIVIGRWPDCGEACLNADIGALFSKDIDVATFSNNVLVKRCTSSTCDTFDATVTPAVTYDGNISLDPGNPQYRAHFPTALTIDRWYRVVLVNGIRSTALEGGAPLALLNYREGSVTENNAYSWTFKTKSGASGCQLDRVQVWPNPASMNLIGQVLPYASAGYSQPDSCSAAGQELTNLGWSWVSDLLYASVTERGGPGTCSQNMCDTHAVAETPALGTNICATGTQAGPPQRSEQGCANLTIQTSRCEDDTDCTRDNTACFGSTCDQTTHLCSPVITSLSRTTGAIGTWLGINGCYFGSYEQGTCGPGADENKRCDSNKDCADYNCEGGSAVIYTDNKRGLWPNEQTCGAPSTHWFDNSILSEVPDRTNASASATDGRIVVQRADGVHSGSSTDTFVVDPAMIVPGICRIDPSGGPEGTSATVQGENFGNSRDDVVRDKVMFYNEQDVTSYEQPNGWTDSQIRFTAPAGIENNLDPNYEYPTGHRWLEGVTPAEVSVSNNDVWSNAVNFNVVPAGCTICSNDAVCGTGRGCGSNGCCAAVPTVVSRSPDDNQVDVCRNTIITARFSLPMSAGSLDTTSVHLSKLNTQDNLWNPVAMTVGYNATVQGLSIIPTSLLDQNTTYQVNLSTGGIVRSADGVALAPYSWTFGTADRGGPCAVQRCELEPTTWTFPSAQPTDTRSRQAFTATVYADNGQQLNEVPGVYEWDWGWSITDTTIADFLQPPTADSNAATVQAKPQKGSTLLVAQAKPTNPKRGMDQTVGCASTITMSGCVSLWNGGEFVDSDTNCMAGSGTCSDYHFTLNYCMDGGLLDLDQKTISGTNGNLLKEFLFKENNRETRDAIGIRIYANNEGLSVGEWYRQKAPRPGNPTTLTVDGYDAIRDGTTIYVGVPDFNGQSYVPRIYLISYDQGANANIVNIYNQLVASWNFNNEPNSHIVCHMPPVSDAAEINKTCIQRDLKRIASLSDIVQSLRSYKTSHGTYPKLESGSFLPQLSFSVWPSWQQTLGAALGKSLPLDSPNSIVECPASQAQDGTCWNETSKTFFCLPNRDQTAAKQSHIYGYQVVQDGSSAKLYANLEYRGAGSWITNPAETICTSPSRCQCFNYSLGP